MKMCPRTKNKANKTAKQSATEKQVHVNIEKPEAKIINIPYGTQETLEETQGTLSRTSQNKLTRSVWRAKTKYTDTKEGIRNR